MLDLFNFAFLANNGQSLGNILRHDVRLHYNDPILKEAAAFKLNTLSDLSSRTCPRHLTWNPSEKKTARSHPPSPIKGPPFGVPPPHSPLKLYCPFWERVWIISRTTQYWLMMDYFWQKAFVIQYNLLIYFISAIFVHRWLQCKLFFYWLNCDVYLILTVFVYYVISGRPNQ